MHHLEIVSSLVETDLSSLVEFRISYIPPSQNLTCFKEQAFYSRGCAVLVSAVKLSALYRIHGGINSIFATAVGCLVRRFQHGTVCSRPNLIW